MKRGVNYLALKESIAYSRNLITGKTKEIIKKKFILPFQGIATVKLYDDLTGKQVYEAKSENRISAVFGNCAFLEGYYYPMLDNEISFLLKGIYSSYPFRVMVLTTGDIPEDPYDYWTWGNIVGYADGWYAYSGSSILRGTVNKAEWARTNTAASGTRHFVIDFPTNAANGTFRSIYWTGGGSDDSTPQSPSVNITYLKRKVMQGTSATSLSSYNLCVDEANLYCLYSKSIVVFDKNTGERKSDIALSATSKAVAYDGLNFWILVSDGSFKKTDKNFNVLNTFSKSEALPGDLVYSVEYCDIYASDNYVYITYKGCTDTSGSNSKYKSCVAKYNKDGTFVSKADIFSGSYGKVFITGIPNNKLWIVINDSSCVQLNENLSIYSITDYSSRWYYSICWDKTKQTLFAYCDSGYGTVSEYYIVPASAHTLLPEPVTKTPTNTMKIQYDFTCDYVYPLDMPAH